MSEPVRGAGQAPVAVEAGADERLVGQVGAGEQARDPVEELRLGQRAGGRQQAVDRPFDPVGERRRGGVAVVAVAQPPAVVADPHQAAAVGAGERLADEGDQPLDVVDGLRRGGRRRGVGCRLARPAAGRAAGGGRPGRARRGSRRAARLGHRLAAELEHVDRRVDDGAVASSAENGASTTRSAGANSRSVGTTSGSPAPPGSGSSTTLARVRGPRGTAPEPGRDELHHAAALAARLGQPRRRDPVARRTPAEHARDQRLGAVALEQEHDPGVAGEHRLDAAQRPRDRRGLPAPARPHRRPEQRLERQRRGRLAAQHPRGAVVRPREPLGDRAQRRRAQRRAGPAAARRRRDWCPASSPSAPSAAGVDCLTTAVADPSARLRRSSPSRAGTGPQAPLSSRWMKPRTTRTPSSNASHGLRSRHCAAARQLDVAARDPERRDPAGRRGEPARRGERVEQRQPDRRRDRRGAEVVLDPLEDRGERGQLARRVEVEQLVAAAPRRPRAPGTGRASGCRSSRPSGSSARATSWASTGAWRCSPPPSWSRQTGQR